MRSTLLLLLSAVALSALACSEGQVSIPGDDDVADAGDDAPGGDDTAPPPDDTAQPPDDTAQPPDDTAQPPTDTAQPSDTTTGGCTAGAVRCSPFTDGVQTCQGGTWVDTEACTNGCQDGACLSAAVSGTCTQPVAMAVGDTVIGTTDTVYNPNIWSQTCRSSYAQQTGISVSPTGPESVFELTVSEAAMLKLRVDAIDPTWFALYVRSECADVGSELHGLCGAQQSAGGVYEVEGFFGPGTYYLFVDDFGDQGNGPGIFELSVEQVLMPSCGGQVPTPLDVRSQLNFSGDTNNGIASEDWLSSDCPVAQSSSGRENVYAFGLSQRSVVSIAATPTDPLDSQIALYVRAECGDRFSQVACGHTAGNDSASIQTTLEAGGYYLFVDDFINSIDGPQRYDLTIETQPAP